MVTLYNVQVVLICIQSDIHAVHVTNRFQVSNIIQLKNSYELSNKRGCHVSLHNGLYNVQVVVLAYIQSDMHAIHAMQQTDFQVSDTTQLGNSYTHIIHIQQDRLLATNEQKISSIVLCIVRHCLSSFKRREFRLFAIGQTSCK